LRNGFTTVERVVAIFGTAVLIAAVAYLLYSAGHVAAARNAERTKDARTILDAVYQLTIDRQGVIPAEITGTLQQIGTASDGCAIQCGEGGVTSQGCLNLDPLLVDAYLIELPVDPAQGSRERTGYAIEQSPGGRIYVYACLAERELQIRAGR
jgi:hypothetical protein